MPYTETKLPNGKIVIRSPHGVKSKGSTPGNAQKQLNLLRAVDHGWKPGHKSKNALARRMGAHD